MVSNKAKDGLCQLKLIKAGIFISKGHVRYFSIRQEQVIKRDSTGSSWKVPEKYLLLINEKKLSFFFSLNSKIQKKDINVTALYTNNYHERVGSFKIIMNETCSALNT